MFCCLLLKRRVIQIDCGIFVSTPHLRGFDYACEFVESSCTNRMECQGIGEPASVL